MACGNASSNTSAGGRLISFEVPQNTSIKWEYSYTWWNKKALLFSFDWVLYTTVFQIVKICQMTRRLWENSDGLQACNRATTALCLT